jgi:hypothetical protein
LQPKLKFWQILLGFDRTLNGGGDDFDCGMINGGIDRGKSGFFSGVDDQIFEGGFFFDCFDRFDGNEGGFFSIALIALTAMRVELLVWSVAEIRSPEAQA